MKSFTALLLIIVPHFLFGQVAEEFKKIVVEDGGVYIEDEALGHGTSRFHYQGFSIDNAGDSIRSMIILSDFRKVWDSYLSYPAPGLYLIRKNFDTNDSYRGAILRSERGLEFLLSSGVNNVPVMKMVLNGDGNLGLGTTLPTAKLTVTQGDVYVTDYTRGVILTSPDGSCFRMTVDNNGNPVFTSIGCP